MISLCRYSLPFNDMFNLDSADIYNVKYRAKTLRTFHLFRLFSSRFLTSITLLRPVWCTCPLCTGYCTIGTGTEYFLVVLFHFCILSYAASTKSVILSCPFSADTSTKLSVLRYVSLYGYFLFVLWSGTVYSLLCLLYTKNST
jgi:hypothetical protein